MDHEEENSHQTEQTPLTLAMLQEVLDSATITDEQLEVLCWLVWLSLLSVEEVARVSGREEKTMWSTLIGLERLHLVAHIVVTESGWPRRHHRYHVTDLGLYVLVALHPEPLSLPKLVQCYPIARADLVARIACLPVHLVLAELVTRLITECPPGYRLASYQQPWTQVYRWQGEQHTWTCDAAFLIETRAGTRHAFYVVVDPPERFASQRLGKTFLDHFAELRRVTVFSGEPLPHLLLLTTPARFLSWGTLLTEWTLEQGTTPFTGALADYRQLAEGALAPIWHALPELVRQGGKSERVAPESLVAWLDTPASPLVIERFTQSFTFQQMLLPHTRAALAHRRRPLAHYIGTSLQEEAVEMNRRERRRDWAKQLAEDLHSKERERRMTATALFTLLLPEREKTILAWLARHPWLSLPDLLTLLHPGCADLRVLYQPMDHLADLGLLQPASWTEGSTRVERRRFILIETALRWLAVRHGCSSPTAYLQQVRKKAEDSPTDPFPPASGGRAASVTKREPSEPVRWTQRGIRDLKEQMPHTNGLYRCVRFLLEAAERTGGYRILDWRSASESFRWHHHPLTHVKTFVRPDAELVYTTPEHPLPARVWLEYDRGTTSARDYRGKFVAYTTYQDTTRRWLPPILMVTPDEVAAQVIRKALHQVGAAALDVILVLEAEVEQDGLLPFLAQLPTPLTPPG